MVTDALPLETQLAQARQELQEQRQRLQELEVRLATREVEAGNVQQLVERLAPEVERLKRERDQAMKQLEEQEQELNRLTEEIYNTYEELNLLYDLGKSTTLDLTELYRTFESRVRLTLDAEEGALVVANDGTLDVVATWGRVRNMAEWQEFCRHLAEEILQRNNSVNFNGFEDVRESTWRTRMSPDLFQRLQKMHTSGEARNMLAVPLRAEKEAMGAVILLNRQPMPGSPDIFLARDEKLLMSLARQTAIAIETVHLSQQLVRQRRMERELEIASTIQASLLPPRPPKVPGVEVAGRCWPANEVGGDYFDYIRLEAGLGVSCGDVMGKGVPAALVMAMTHSALRSAARDNPMPGRLLSNVNNIMYEDCDRIETNLTLCYCVFDTQQSCMYFSNAGHLPPMIWRAAGREVEYLRKQDGPGTMIGVLEEVAYLESRTPLSSGDIVLLYSDGVTEATNQAGDYFGEEGLEELLKTHADAPLETLVTEIFNVVNQYALGLPQGDDITVVAIRVVPT